MEAVLGDIEYTAAVIEEALSALNDLYRRIVMITGSVPDTLRDYSLQTQIPGWDLRCAATHRFSPMKLRASRN